MIDPLLDDRLDKIEDMVKEIKAALTGNGLGEARGLIRRVGTLEGKAKDTNEAVKALALEQDKRWSRVKWTASGIGIGAGIGGAAFGVGLARLLELLP